MKIYFVRHGETDLNANEKEQGAEGSLNELGRQQAGFVAKRFDAIPIEIIISSPYPRTKETAEIINKNLKKEIIYSDFLIERRPPSKFIGVSYHDPEYVSAIHLMEEKRMVDPSWHYADEDSFTELKDRAIRALKFLKSLNKETMLVVTHGGILRVMVSVMMIGEEVTYREYHKMYWFLKTKNTGITVVEYADAIITQHPGWKLIAWNDHAHL